MGDAGGTCDQFNRTEVEFKEWKQDVNELTSWIF